MEKEKGFDFSMEKDSDFLYVNKVSQDLYSITIKSKTSLGFDERSFFLNQVGLGRLTGLLEVVSKKEFKENE